MNSILSGPASKLNAILAHDPDGIGLANDVRQQEWERRSRKPAWVVTALDLVDYQLSNRLTLDEVVDEVVREFEPGGADQVVWQGRRAVAVVRMGPDGVPVAVRLND